MSTIVGEVRAVLGRAARDVRDRLHARDIDWHDVAGTDFRVRGGNWMAAGGSGHEQVELALFTTLLESCDAVIDVGANSGLYSLIAAAANKPCFAFEPLRDNLEHLYATLADNGLEERVEVFPIAASDSAGIARFYGRGQGASLVAGWAGQPAYDFEQVATNTLDNLLADRLAGKHLALKIDVEGAEMRVLRGAPRLLAGCRSVLLEHSLTRNQPNGRNPDFMALFDLMWQAGFSAHVADPPASPVTRARVGEWIASGRVDTGTENFLFRRDG